MIASRAPTLSYIALVSTLLLCACRHRVLSLPADFWRLDGSTVAEQRLAKGDSGLIFVHFPDSSGLAFTCPINLEIDPRHEFYYLKWGDLGVDSLTLGRARDSIGRFLNSYDVRVLAARLGVTAQQMRAGLERSCPDTARKL